MDCLISNLVLFALSLCFSSLLYHLHNSPRHRTATRILRETMAGASLLKKERSERKKTLVCCRGRKKKLELCDSPETLTFFFFLFFRSCLSFDNSGNAEKMARTNKRVVATLAMVAMLAMAGGGGEFLVGGEKEGGNWEE